MKSDIVKLHEQDMIIHIKDGIITIVKNKFGEAGEVSINNLILAIYEYFKYNNLKKR
jgi:hypothetical protein